MAADPKDLKRKVWASLTKGIDKEQASSQLLDGYIEASSNLRVRDAGQVGTDIGLEQRGLNTTLRGSPQLTVWHKFNNGTEELLQLTTATLYRFVDGVDEWFYVPAVATTVFGTEAGLQTAISVTDSAGFAADDFVGITLDDGAQHQTTIATNGVVNTLLYDNQSGNFTVGQIITGGSSGATGTIATDVDDGATGTLTLTGITGTFQTNEQITDPVTGVADTNGIVAFVITIDDALPSQAASTDFVKAVDLVGAVTQPVCSVPWKPNDWIVFNNAVDEPIRYNGTLCIDMPGLAFGGTTITKCRWITAAHNQLLMFSTTEGGTAYPSRVRGCDIADGTDWDDTSGSSFYEDIPEPVGEGMRAEPFGDGVALYFDEGLIFYEYINSATALWRYRTVTQQDGLKAPMALVALPGMHMFLGHQDVYTWKGGVTFGAAGREGTLETSIPIGRSAISALLTGPTAIVDASVMQQSYMANIPALREAWLVCPDSAGVLNILFRYYLPNRSWSIRTLPGTFINAIGSKRVSGTTWAELQTAGTKWSDLVSTTWAGFTSEAAESLLCRTDSAMVAAHSALAGDDFDTAIQWSITLGDVREPPFRIHSQMIDIFAKGATITVELSEDSGTSWIDLGSVTPLSTLSRLRKHANKSGTGLQIRLSGTGQTVIEWVALTYTLDTLET